MHSTSHRFLYLHVSKTGGNSIQKILLPLSEDELITNAHQDGVDRFGLRGAVTPSKHATLAEYEHRQPGIAQSCQVAISVRDPFERALSAYFSPHRWMVEDAQGQFRLSDPTWSETHFTAFLDSGAIRPAVDWLRLNGTIRQPDHVIRFETLAQDLARFLAAVGVDAATLPPLPHVNKSADTTSLKQRLARDATLRQMVMDRFQEDAALFGYA